MGLLKYSIGMDVSSKDIKLCLSSIDTTQLVKVVSTLTINNTSSGFLTALNWMKKWHKDKEIPLVICMEATGVYHENCALYFYEKDFKVSIILPNKAKKYLQSLGLKSKNDKIDAQGLSRMGAEQKLSYWTPAVKFYSILRILTRQHQCLQEQMTSEKNRLHAAVNSAVQSKFELKQTNNLIEFLEKQLKSVKKEIETHCKTDIQMQRKFEQLCKIYGIAILSAATIIAETNGFELFENHKQVVSYAGYDVVENQSGRYAGKTKISKKGNSRIRRILHMPALKTMQRKDSNFGKLYDRVVEKTGIKMKGAVAVQKKLLVIIFHIWKKDLSYESNFNEKKATENIETIETISESGIKTVNEFKDDCNNEQLTNLEQGLFLKEEQATSLSRLALQKPQQQMAIKKIAITSMAKQGKRSVSDHSSPPLSVLQK